MKMRNKGKVHPSPSSCASSNKDNNTLSILNLLPAAILAIASVLSLEDRQVLAYMVTRSMKQPTTTTSHFSKKKFISHKSPLFDCECFDCYTTYWFRWDSSPNRELIHQVIEAFEEHLNTNEQHNKNRYNNSNKKRDKKEKGQHSFIIMQQEEKKTILPENTQEDDEFVHVSPENADVAVENADVPVTTVLAAANGGHKGLARKVLPDVLGLFNSRLWNLWSPNM